MPFSTEELAKKFGDSAEDVKKSLEGMLGAADDVDKVFEKMTERQEAAAQIQDKFAKALASSSKSLTGIGHSGISAARGIKTIDSVSRSAASSLGSLGIGAVSAVAGFKALSSGASSFSSDIENTEKSIAGLVKGIGGLEAKLGGLKAASVSVDVVIGSLSALDDFEKRIKALPQNVSVNVSTGAAAKTGAGAASASAGAASAKAMANAAAKAMASRKTPASAGTLSAAMWGGPNAAKKAGRLSGEYGGKAFAENYAEQVAKNIRSKSIKSMKDKMTLMADDTEKIKTPEGKKKYVELAVKIGKKGEVSEILDELSDNQSKLFKRNVGKMGMEKAIDSLIAKTPILALRVKKAMSEAAEAAEEAISPFKRLEDQVNSEAKTFKEFISQNVAKGGVEFGEFAGGLTKSATGMFAVGLAAAFVATKISEMAEKYANYASELAKYRVETSALEDTIAGLGKNGLEPLRKELGLTRDQAADFYQVLKTGVNELGMSPGKIMEVSKALSDTFGGDQTARLKQYVDLLKEIPTIDADLSITASMDDQAASIYALAKSGKMDVVMDLQSAGLFGGKQERKEGADLADSNQAVAKNTEAIKDFLTGSLFGTWTPYLVALTQGVSALVAAFVSGLAIWGGMKAVQGVFKTASIATMWATCKAMVAAILSSKSGGRGRTGKGAVKGAVKGASTTAAKAAAKAVGSKAAATVATTASKKVATTAAKSAISLSKFGGIAAKIGPKLLGIGLAVVGVELACGMAADKLEETGKTAAAAGTRIAGSAASIAGFALTGATIGGAIGLLGGPLAAVTATAGAVVGALVGLAVEAKTLYKSFKTLGVSAWEYIKKFGSSKKSEPTTALGKAAIELNAQLIEEHAKMAKSGMALEQSMNRLKAAVNSAKFEFLELSARLSKIQLKNIGEIGGSMAGFTSAMQKGEDAARKIFNEKKAVNEAERKRIMGSTDMQPDQRQSAYDTVREAELKAANDFAEALSDLATTLYQTPELIQNGLKREIAGTTLGQAQDTGAFTREYKDVAESKDIGLAKEAVTKTQEAMVKSSKMVSDSVKAYEEAKVAAVASGNDLLKKYDEELLNDKMDGAKRLAMQEERNRLKALQDSKAFGTDASKELVAAKGRQGKKKAEIEILEDKRKGEFEIKPMADAASSKKELDIYGKQKKKLEEKRDIKQKELTDVGGSDEKSEEALKEVDKLKGEIKELNEKMTPLMKTVSEVSSDLSIKIKAIKPDLPTEKITEAVEAIMNSGGDIDKMSKALEGFGLAEVVKESINKTKEITKEIGALKDQKGVIDQVVVQHESVVSKEDGVTTTLKAQLEAVKKHSDAVNELVNSYKRSLEGDYKELRVKRESVTATQEQVAIAGLHGSATAELAKLGEEEGNLAREEYAYAKSSVKQLEGIIAEHQKAVDLAKQVSDANPKDLSLKKVYERALIEMAGYETLASNAKDSSERAIRKLKLAGEGVDEGLQGFAKSITGINLTNISDLASTLAESAEYTGDVGKASAESFRLAKYASDEWLKNEKEIIKARIATAKANIEAEAEIVKQDALTKNKDMSPEAAEALKQQTIADMKSAVANKEKLAYAQAELKHKKDVVGAAKRSKELKEGELNIQQGLIDDAMSFASEFGGSFASINALQNLSVGVARQQLDVAKEFRDNIQQAFEAAAGDANKQAEVGKALFQAQADVATQTLNLRRKELGVQKNMMEQMLGGVFGEMRSNFGARRQMGSDVSMMGINATRMKSASGMYVNTPGGKPGTIEERRNRRMLGGAGGAGPLDELAKMGGPMAEVAKAMNKSPSREQQAKLLEEANATSKNTKDVANSTSRGDQPGSFYTHDTTAEGLLGGILGVLRELTVGMLDSAFTSKSKDAGVVGKRLDDVIAGAAKTAASVKATTTQKEDTTAGVETIKKNSEKVAGLEDAIRIRENENPIATGVEDHNRVRAGRPMTADGANKAYMEAYQKFGEGSKEVEAARKDYEIASSNSVEANKASVGENRASPVSAAKKARNMSKMVGIGGRSSLMGTMLGGMRTGIKEMGGLGNTKEMSGLGSMKEMRGLKPLGGVTKQGGNTSGGVKTVGGATATGLGMTKAGYAANTAGGDTMASRAAGTEVAPPSVGMTAARAPGGSTGGGGIEAGSSITVKGEMMVKFDNKMFQQQMTAVVLTIMNNSQAQKQIQNAVLKKS
jgi:hypothetical protein